jgi:hypothetical protein
MLQRLSILRGYKPTEDEINQSSKIKYAMQDAKLLQFPKQGVGSGFQLKNNYALDILWKSDVGQASFSTIKGSTNFSATCDNQNDKLPQVYTQHQRFVDMSLLPTSALGEANLVQSGTCTPRYINVDRDPVDKCVSSYYFELSDSFKTADEMKQKHTDVVYQGKVDINECVAVRAGWQAPRADVDPTAYDICLRLCMPMGRASWMFYCGFHEDCEQVNASMFPNQQPGEEQAFSPKYPERAYARAKKNVEDHFAVVGITSRMNDTLKLLEHRLPQFFAGAVWLAQNLRKKKGSLHFLQSGRIAPAIPEGHDKNYIAATPKVRAWLESQMPEAMSFYRFLEERFSQQLKDVSDSDLDSVLLNIDSESAECP